MSKLSELVKSAIADAETKIASARDVRPEVPETSTKTASAAPAPAPVAEKRASVTKTAAQAMEIATALDNLAVLMLKIASSGQPAKLESEQKGSTKDTPTKATTLSHQQASSGGAPSSGMEVAALKSAAEQIFHAKIAQAEALHAAGHEEEAQALAEQAQAEFQKEASRFDRAAKAIGETARDVAFNSGKGAKALTEPGAVTRGARKVVGAAQSVGKRLGGTDINSDTGRGLMAMGGGAAAAAGAAGAGVAAARREKKAYEEEDGSTRTPSASPKNVEALASTPAGGTPGGVARDNAGMASLTKRDAKVREKGEIAKHVSEPAFSAKSDRGIQDNLDNTAGAKIASVREKIAAKASAKASAKV